MADSEDRAAAREQRLVALRDLVASDGWKVFLDYVESEWGDGACIHKIDEALRRTPAGDDAAADQTVLQIRASAIQIRSLVNWPTQQLAVLRGQRAPVSINPMEMLRRIARPGPRR